MFAVRKVSDALRVPRRVGWVFAFIGVENAFSPFRSEGEARVARTAKHLEGRNEVENRNEACVMKVASLGSRAKMRTKEGEIEKKKKKRW